MKVLVLLVVGVLGCSLTGARIVSVCELRDKLAVAINNLPEDIQNSGLTGGNFSAKIACYVDHGSKFDTSVKTDLNYETCNQKGHGNSSHNHGSNEHHRKRRDTYQLLSNGDTKENVTLYGLFQLPGDLVCNDSMIASSNMCGMDCMKLTDDDIDDDIMCVLTLITNIVEQGFSSPNIRELTKVIRLMMQAQCKNAQYDDYFSEC